MKIDKKTRKQIIIEIMIEDNKEIIIIIIKIEIMMIDMIKEIKEIIKEIIINNNIENIKMMIFLFNNHNMY